MANEITEHFGLPLPDPAAFLEYDVFKLRDAISGIDSAMQQAASNLEQRAQALDALIEQRATALAQSKLDASAIVDVAHGGTGANSAANARANLNVPTRTGDDASGNWSINITGSAASATDPNAMPKTGGAFTGGVSTKLNSGAVTGAGGSTLQVMGDAANAAFISFHRSGAYAINFGLDTDNVIRMGGWSQGAGATRLTIGADGAFTASNNVTAYSDVRLKYDIQNIGGALKMVRKMRGVFFKRTDEKSGKRHVGVIAQEMREVLPEVVQENRDTADAENVTLSVAYGNIAGVLIEAVKELAADVEKLKRGIHADARL